MKPLSYGTTTVDTRLAAQASAPVVEKPESYGTIVLPGVGDAWQIFGRVLIAFGVLVVIYGVAQVF